jgi:hypothetical protein
MEDIGSNMKIAIITAILSGLWLAVTLNFQKIKGLLSVCKIETTPVNSPANNNYKTQN